MISKEEHMVLGVGELLWDLLPSGKQVGGAPANFAFHANQAGVRAFALSAVGNDGLGNELMEQLRQHQIDHLLPVVDFPTGTVQVVLQNGIPNYFIQENVAWDHIPFTPEMRSLAVQADAICFGTLALRNTMSRDTIQRLLRVAPSPAILLFDINLRQNFYDKPLIEDMLNRANALKLNDDEVEVLIRMFSLPEDADEACQVLIARFNLRLLIFTAGAKYSTVYYQGERSHQSTPQVNVQDTIGAGDCFAGSLIACLLRGMSLSSAHAYAVDAAAMVCQHAGAWIVHNTHE